MTSERSPESIVDSVFLLVWQGSQQLIKEVLSITTPKENICAYSYFQVEYLLAEHLYLT